MWSRSTYSLWMAIEARFWAFWFWSLIRSLFVERYLSPLRSAETSSSSLLGGDLFSFVYKACNSSVMGSLMLFSSLHLAIKWTMHSVSDSHSGQIVSFFHGWTLMLSRPTRARALVVAAGVINGCILLACQMPCGLSISVWSISRYLSVFIFDASDIKAFLQCVVTVFLQLLFLYIHH